MPEATVDKDSHLGTREYDVRPTPKPGDDLTVHAIAQAPAMEQAPDCSLWPGVSAALPLHPPLGFRGGGGWPPRAGCTCRQSHSQFDGSSERNGNRL